MVGNDHHLDTSHIGKTFILYYHASIKVINVLVVSQFTKNMLSISKLTCDNNMFIEFHALYCLLKDNLGNVLFKEMFDGVLYKLFFTLSTSYSTFYSSSITVIYVHQPNLVKNHFRM